MLIDLALSAIAIFFCFSLRTFEGALAAFLVPALRLLPAYFIYKKEGGAIPFYIGFAIAGLSFFLLRGEGIYWLFGGMALGYFLKVELPYALLGCALFDWLGVGVLVGVGYGAVLKQMPLSRESGFAISMGLAGGQIAFHLLPITPAAPIFGFLFPFSALAAYYLFYDRRFAR